MELILSILMFVLYYKTGDGLCLVAIGILFIAWEIYLLGSRNDDKTHFHRLSNKDNKLH